MATTYEKIASTTLGSAQSSITFNSIPATYTDIRLVFTGTGSGGNCLIRFNSDSGTNYSYTAISGNGTSAASDRGTGNGAIILSTQQGVGTVPTMRTCDIFSYAGSTYKTCLNNETSDENGSGAVVRSVGLWRNTAAITSILITTGNANTYATGTTATLYGILKA